MQDTTLMTLASLAGAVVTAFFGGIVLIINAWNKAASRKRSVEFTEQSKIIDRQEKQIARLERQILDQQQAIAAIQAQHTECREDAAELRAAVSILHAAIQRAGIVVELPPELSAARLRRAIAEAAEAEKVVRDTEQNTKLLASVDEQLKIEKDGDRASPDR